MPLSWSTIRDRAVAFSREYASAASEKSLSQQYWRDFFNVFGVDAKKVSSFEQHVKLKGAGLGKDGHPKLSNGWIDVFWPGKLLIEMKSAGQDLEKAFGQALNYFDNLPERDLPRYILVCDFQQFRLYDLEANTEQHFTLKDLAKHIRAFAFISGYDVKAISPQDPVNIKAAQRMGALHDLLSASGYGESNGGKDLEVLLVRLLFCLFADDTGIFQPAGSFKDRLDELADPAEVGRNLSELFDILNTPEDKRQKTHQENYQAFRYINGNLFAERISSPAFDAPMREALLEAAALDWSSISPAIFGALFQSIMDKEARRNLGAHYTSEENILKLIGPLFLDALWAEFGRVKSNKTRLFEFHKRLRQLTFFDPACGCGNFLVITYRELRKLEADILRTAYNSGQQVLDIHTFTTVNVDQFYGIEIEEFPAQIAQVALWLTDHQMNSQLSDEFGQYFARLPLVTSPHIHHGNALQVDWEEVLPAARCSYVLGNPPFVGAKYMGDAQRADASRVFTGLDNAGLLDFVAAWYVKAARYMKGGFTQPEATKENWDQGNGGQIPIQEGSSIGARNAKTKLGSDPHFPLSLETTIRAAFVSTNSITQGEQVGVLWGWMLAQGIQIHFAHRTFRWSNEASGKAAVHCVIIGFGLEAVAQKTIYEYADIAGAPLAVLASNINPYLVDAANVVLPRRRVPICDAPEIGIGNKPIDGGWYLFTTEEKRDFLKLEPKAEKWFRRWLGAEEFLNGFERWCLWLGECPPNELRAMPEVMKRVRAVQGVRLGTSPNKRGETPKKPPPQSTQALAATPTRFHVENIPSRPYLLLPEVSSERRQFIPLGFEPASTLASNLVKIAPNAGIFHFGILSSTMHNAWVRYTCGRLESRYRYSKDIVYNNFPWPDLEQNQPLGDIKHAQNATKSGAKKAIEAAAQAVLDARAQFPGSSLADLYDPLTMPPALVKAHQKLDSVVDKAYEQCAALPGKKSYKTDAERVAYLFELYQRLTSLLPAELPKKKRR